ncbi:hypothetical protein [Psychrobacillus sp. L3]|uniref:hypothetical protein n=1 Tax=Psychrobacillus sp. L3 TaxID=3236891 RepID=UPI0036F1D9CB
MTENLPSFTVECKRIEPKMNVFSSEGETLMRKKNKHITNRNYAINAVNLLFLYTKKRPTHLGEGRFFRREDI